MAIRFILGRAGTGKTRHCFERITAMLREAPLGPRIYWLLPKQATFEAERDLTCRLGGFTRVHVVSFDQLGKEILADCGDVGIPQVTPMGRRMVVGHLLRKHQDNLRFYRASARRPGLAAELDSTFGEFERAGLDTPALDDLLHQIEPPNDPGSSLGDKLHDVQLLFNAYHAYIGQDRLDPQQRLDLVLQRVTECAPLKEATLFVDDFYDFTGYEQKLLVAVARTCRLTEIALLADPDSPVVRNPHALPDDLSVFHRTERTYRSLYWALHEAKVPIDPPMLLREPKRFGAPGLVDLERNLFGESFSNHQFTSDIEFLDAPDARTEVDAAARRIRLALRNGLRLREIALLVRDINDYQELIDASFAEHDLPYFVDRRRTAAHHPLLQFVRACLLIARHGWPHDAVMVLLKTGLAGVSDLEADELENYVLRHRIRGHMWESKSPWGFRRELIRGDEDDLLPIGLTETSPIDDARNRVVGKLSPFVAAVRGDKPLPMRQIVTQLFTVLEAFHVRRTLAKWMTEAERAGELEKRGEHEQVWAELVKLFEHLVDLLGDEPVTLSDFLDVLDSGLESFDLALAPPTVDQILVGQMDRTRTPEVQLVIVLGLNEGQFPRVQREDCVLSDSERRLLQKQKVNLDPDSERRLLDERLLAYVAFTRASRQLLVTRRLADDDGRPCNPSPFWNELLRLSPNAPVQHIPRPSRADPQSIGTPRQLVTALMRWVHIGAPAADPWPALYQWLAEHACCNDALDTMRYRAWKALGYTNTTGLSTETAAKLFPAPLHATVKRLETFAACPFQHFIRYGLQLQDREEPDVTAIDLSNAYHRVLENLVADILQTRKDWCELDPQVTSELIRTHVAEIGRTLRGELMLSTARNRYLLERIEKTLEQAIEAQREMHRRGKYRPAFASLKFGGDHGTLPAHRIATPAGQEVHLRGQIDRVDLNDKRGAFTVSDYKLAAGALQLDHVYHGLSLQLLTYLLVVRENGQQLAERKLTPAAAFFLQLLRSPQSVDHPSEAKAPDHPDFHLRVKPRGIIDVRAVHSLDAGMTEGSSQVISAFIKKDGQAGNRQNTDVAEEAEFTALLQHVEKRLGQLADQIIAGGIGISPYWINRETPCSRCEYRGVCRFEPGINQYHVLTGMKREEVLQKLTGGNGEV
jgi:ATP-dependent helicase/nuclease subunit B